MALRGLLLAAILIGLAGCADTSVDRSRCQQASAAQIAAIRAGVKGVTPRNDVRSGYAVKSTDRQNVYFVAAKIYGNGIEQGAGPGVWAMGGTPDRPASVMAVDGYAKEFSDWGPGDRTAAQVTMFEDGVAEAKACAR